MNPPEILAIIPARGGSKRLAGKNLLPLGNIPLISWSIRAAQASGCCVDTLVSTDAQEIADVARSEGALVPWLRPAILATDTANSIDVLHHALSWYQSEKKSVDAILLLQPTSPFRTAETINRAVQAFSQPEENRLRPLVSVSRSPTHPGWSFFVDRNQLKPCLGWDLLQHRSQDLPPAYALNGAIYILPAEQVRQRSAIVTPDTQAFLMDSMRESLDIDTPEDWAMANYWLNQPQ